MCGIVGYIGRRQAQPIILSALSRLEYRGYDSCGIAIAENHNLIVHKDKLRVGELAARLPAISGTIGIGHTRWATCGEPSPANAHPHLDCTGQIAVVHNGIINNYQELKKKLIASGHVFTSETDTEVLAHLIEERLTGSLEEAVEAALKEVSGSYAVAVLRAGDEKVLLARRDSPLVVGLGDGEVFIGSDVPAFLEFTNRVVYLEEGDIGVATAGGLTIRRCGVEVKAIEERISWDTDEARCGGYEHFMLKEIHEQPRVVRDTLTHYTQKPEPVTGLLDLAGSLESVLMLACGTSYHAAMVAKYMFEDLIGISVRLELASEFNYYPRALGNTLAVLVTQSGETADTLKAARRLKAMGCRLLAMTNVCGSAITRIAHKTLYTQAGPEMSVAATKTFLAQITLFYCVALSYAQLDRVRLEKMLQALRQMPNTIQQVLDAKENIGQAAGYFKDCHSALFIGRGINYPVALEGALKLKEISYIHAEGYAAGELKHGPFALLDELTPVVALVCHDRTYEAMLNNIREVKARRAPVVALTDGADDEVAQLADCVIELPAVEPLLTPMVNSVALQLLAYYTARERGCAIDFPRNLAKSVTVE